MMPLPSSVELETMHVGDKNAYFMGTPSPNFPTPKPKNAHILKLQRICSQRTGDEYLKKAIDYMLGRALRSSRGKAWEARTRPVVAIQTSKEWVFSTTIQFKKISGQKRTEEKQWQEIIRFISDAGQGSKFGQYPWTIVEVDGQLVSSEGVTKTEDDTVIVLPTETRSYFDKLGLDPDIHFNHLYKREPQIKIGLGAIKEAVRSEFVNRFNTVYYGPPGCGKSDLMVGMGKMLGPENEAWIKFDATSMTAPGVQKILLESDHVPPIMFVEEIEKVTDDTTLHFLLGLMDVRGEVRKTNFRIGHKARNVKMLVIASANNVDLLKKVASGAIWSRFANKVYCPRPDRALLHKILLREVQKNGGKEAWIEPTLQYCFDKNKMTDPREIIPVCLQGGDELLNNVYQTALEAVRPPQGE